MTRDVTYLLGIAETAKNVALDAPLVAVTWVEILRRGYASEQDTLPIVVAALVFATVWLIYMFDRLMDVRLLKNDLAVNRAVVSDRHRFAKRHETVLWPLWVVVGVLTVAAAFAWMDAELRRVGLIHLAGVAFYFVFVHCRSLAGRGFLTGLKAPKEITVGVLFALGVTMTVAQPWTLTVAVGFVLLAALFSLNCLIVAHSEPTSDGSAQGPTDAQSWRWTRRNLIVFGLLIGVTSVLLMLVTDLPRLIAVATGGSAWVSSLLCRWQMPDSVEQDIKSPPRSSRIHCLSESLADAVLVGVPLVVVASWPVLGHVVS